MKKKPFELFLIIGLQLFATILLCQNERIDTSRTYIKQLRDSFQHYMYSDIDKALYFGELAQEDAELRKHTRDRLVAIVNNGIGYSIKGNIDTCFYFINVALSSPELSNYKKLQYSAYNLKANAFRFQSKWDSSEMVFQYILNNSICPTKNEEVNILINYGSMLGTKKDLESSLIYYIQADSLIEQGFGHERDKYVLLENIGSTYFDLQNYEETIKYKKRELELAKEKNYKNNLSGIYNTLAESYLQTHNLNLGASMLDTALLINEDNKIEKGVSFFRYANYYIRKDDYKNAILSNEKSYAFLKEAKDDYFLLFVISQKLNIKNELDELSNTLELVQEARNTCNRYMSKEDSLNLDEFEIRFIAKNKLNEPSYNKVKTFLDEKNEFIEKNYKETLHEQLVKFQTQKKEKLLLEIQLKNEQNENELIEKNLVLARQGVIAISLLLLLIILGILYYSRLKKLKRIKEQAKISEQIIKKLEMENNTLIEENKVTLKKLISTTNRKDQEEHIETIGEKKFVLFNNETYKLKDILYLESRGDAIHYFTKDNAFHPPIYGALKKYSERLFKFPPFLLVHRKHLINIINIESYDKKSLLIKMTNGDVVKIANKRKSEVINTLEKYFSLESSYSD